MPCTKKLIAESTESTEISNESFDWVFNQSKIPRQYHRIKAIDT